MKQIAALLSLLVLASAMVWAATYNPGQLAISIPAGTSTTGAGTFFFFSGVYNKYTWEVVVSGGTASAITTNFECSIDGGTTVSTADTSTSTSGEVRSVVNKPSLGCRCNITTYTTNGTTAACQFVASADPR
jgi:hypothetical protein